MGEQDYVNLLLDNIAFQYRHKDYERAIALRNFCRMIVTGENQDSEVTRYRRFEDDALKKQRVRLYNPLTQYALARPRKYWKRLLAVEGIRSAETAPDEKAVTELRDAFHSFVPGKTLEMWLNEKLEYLGVNDPNAWIIYERHDDRAADGQILKTTVYPYVVPSVDALNYAEQYGKLQWFLCRATQIETIIQGGTRMDVTLENYYLYAPGLIVRAREIGQKTVQEDGEAEQYVTVFPFKSAPQTDGAPVLPMGGKERRFYLKVIQNGTTEVPAMIAGAYLDEVSGQSARVAWFEPARHVLYDLIRYKSSLDVVTTVHTYPRRYEFVKPCRFTNDLGECVGGWLDGVHNQDHLCPSCRGSGKAANFTTEQDVLQLIMPDDPSALVELSKLAFTEPVDTTLPAFLSDQVELAETRVMAAVFDSGLYQRPDQTQTRTATEIDAVMQGIADVLQPFARHECLHYELAWRIGAQYREIAGFVVDRSYPDELDISTMAELVAAFDSIKNSGVGYDIIAAQRRRIQEKAYDGNPEQQKKVAARYAWLPFDDKTQEEVAMILSARSPLDGDRILYENWLGIFREIENETPAFADMTREMQAGIVAGKVQQFRERILLIDQMPPA